MKKRIYLAGPITGQTYEGARFSWRQEFAKQWTAGAHSLVADVYSPMRGKDFLLGTREIQGHPGAYKNPMAETRGILARDREDVARADLIVAHFLGAPKVSIGTMVEFGWADAYRRPVISIIEAGNMHQHEFVIGLSSYVVDNLEEAVAIAAAVLTPGI